MKRTTRLTIIITTTLFLIVLLTGFLWYLFFRGQANQNENNGVGNTNILNEENEAPSLNNTQTNNTVSVVNNTVVNNTVNNTPTNATPNPTPTPVSSKEISRGDTSKKQVIFTFDGGSGAQSAEAILGTLNKHHVQGTFFLTGKWAEANPSLVKKIAQNGNEIFNHTYDHKDLTTLTDTQIADELSHAERIISGLTGVTTKPYFRPPYGARNQHVREFVALEGYQSIFWTVDALDWKESSGETASQVKTRILSNVQPGTIFLMHIGDTITGSILDDVFTQIESRGYSVVSLTKGI